ncbi:MAG: hypothetical protein WC596_04195 [Candidatus Shapirobacteria bacterium]
MDYWQKFIELSQQPYFPQALSLLNIVLIFTTALVAYFSWKTANKANELQLMPLLAVYFKGIAMKDRKIRIRNIGKSPAYDIKIESFVNIVRDIQKVWRLDLSMTGTNILVPDEERDLKIESTSNGVTADMAEFIIFHLDPEAEHKRDRIGLLLTFRNAEGNYYYSRVETGFGGLKMFPAKKLNIIGKMYVCYRKYSEMVLLSWYRLKWKFTNPHIEQPK